ncbi:MAG TPA: hypothetical protein VN901_01925 [Candidatus Acidoferrales bacterium]|nr:hypothetical protein [Candidatus Acidoferrales bacterium]
MPLQRHSTEAEAATPEAVTLAAGTLPAGTPAGATRVVTSAGCTPGPEKNLPDMQDSEHPLVRILRPMRRHTCGTPRQLANYLFHGFRQRFSGLRRFSPSAPTAKFLWFRLVCALIAVSSSTTFRGFLPLDASSTA